MAGRQNRNGDTYIGFLVALLSHRPESDGWVTNETLSSESGVSRATTYRYLAIARTNGIHTASKRSTTGERMIRTSLVLLPRDMAHKDVPPT